MTLSMGDKLLPFTRIDGVITIVVGAPSLPPRRPGRMIPSIKHSLQIKFMAFNRTDLHILLPLWSCPRHHYQDAILFAI